MNNQEIKDEIWLIIDSLNPDEKHDDNIAKKINVLWEVIDRIDELEVAQKDIIRLQRTIDIKEMNIDSRIRLIVLGRDEDLDILVNDENWEVRRAVAEHGRPEDLDILVHDSDWEVREAVRKQLEKQQSETSLDSEAKDMSAAKDAQDTPAVGHDKDKGVI